MPLLKRKREFPLKVSDIMVRDLVTTGRDATIQEVARLMFDRGVGRVLIVDEKGKVAGIVTERDMVYAIAGDKACKGLPIWTIMTENPVTISPNTLIVEAIEKMRSLNVRHMPVVDDEGRPIGMVSFRDIADAAALLLSILR